MNDSVVFTSGFSAEIFDSTAANADAIRVTENQSGYSVNIGGQNITLTRAQLQDIQSRSFGGVEAENPDGSYKPTSVVLGNENQHDALDAYGAAKVVVAAGVVTAHLHEQSDEMEVTYNGSIPTEIPNNVRTAAAAR